MAEITIISEFASLLIVRKQVSMGLRTRKGSRKMRLPLQILKKVSERNRPAEFY